MQGLRQQNITIVAPHEMYVKHWEEWIEYKAILDLQVKAKVDITFIHWWAMHLYLMVKDMDIFAFIHTLDPTKVKVGERERQEDEPRLLETTVARTVPLLPVAPDRGESELEANVDKLFDGGGSGTQTEQGDFADGGGSLGINIQPVVETMDIAAEDAVPLLPRRQKKRKTVVADAGEPSHPPKKLREDHETLSGASIGGKSRFTVQRLFAEAVHNAEVRGDPIPTLPFVIRHTKALLILGVLQHTEAGYGSGFILIAEYGADFAKASGKGKAKKAARLLYSGGNHYDLLV
nr:ulp1 protease family, C-terminal catalytic domain-containing protein [Tanacetum cinerariifolium]